MTHAATCPVPRDQRAVPSQEGPVLLATKPFAGFHAPLEVARWLAEREDRELRVVSVLEHHDELAMAAGVPMLPPRYYDEERESLAAQLRDDLASLAGAASRTSVDVLEGPSAPAVVDAARHRDARLIVVGTGHHEPIGRYLYGERALQIVALADRPVLVVPDDAVAAPVALAVVAVDFSPASVRAARAVLPMLSNGGRLVIVHVKPGVTLKEETAGWWNDAYERRCADRFAQFLRQLPPMPGISIETKFLRGEPARTVVDYAATLGAGLLACGRLGHSLAERVFVGSVSSAVVRLARCPVLIAPQLPCDAAVG